MRRIAILLVALGPLACADANKAWCYDVEGKFLKPNCRRTEDSCETARVADKAELGEAAAQRGEPVPRFSGCERYFATCLELDGGKEQWCYSSNRRCLEVRAMLIKNGKKSRVCREELPRAVD